MTIAGSIINTVVVVGDFENSHTAAPVGCGIRGEYTDGNGIPAALRQPQRQRPYGPRLQNAAAVKAFLAAKGYLAGQFPTLASAASFYGTNLAYTAATVVLVKAGDDDLIEKVLRGSVSLLAAAGSVRRVVRMVEDFGMSTATERRLFGRVIGPAKVFDDIVVAAL
jgi:hypothetical protein